MQPCFFENSVMNELNSAENIAWWCYYENKIWGQNYAHWKEYILFTMQIEKPVFNFFS